MNFLTEMKNRQPQCQLESVFSVYMHTVTISETVSSARGNWQFRTLKLAVPTLETTRVGNFE